MTVATGSASTIETAVAGLTIRSLVSGDGEPLVVFHHSYGNPGWLPLYDDLARDHRVHVPDLPGFGSSDRPDWARHPRDVAILMGMWADAIGARSLIGVGCGFGGWVAAELATMRPALFDRLVLVGAAGILPDDGRILDQMLTSHGGYVKASFHDASRYESVYGRDYTDDLLLTWDLNREMVARIAWKPYMYNRQMVPLLAELATPTLVVWGEHDEVVPRECADKYHRLLRNSTLEIVPGSGHAVDMEQPAALANLIRRAVTSM
jgi:pimeloyl-ACP methyl ester carboxylesterase